MTQNTHTRVCVCVCVCVYIYIYIYIYNLFYLNAKVLFKKINLKKF
jgi:hypothetical protein